MPRRTLVLTLSIDPATYKELDSCINPGSKHLYNRSRTANYLLSLGIEAHRKGQNTYQQPASASAAGAKKEKPALKIYLKDAQGKRIDDSEIALWENKSKTGKTYLSGKDKKGNKYVGFPGR